MSKTISFGTALRVFTNLVRLFEAESVCDDLPDCLGEDETKAGGEAMCSYNSTRSTGGFLVMVGFDWNDMSVH